MTEDFEGGKLERDAAPGGNDDGVIFGLDGEVRGLTEEMVDAGARIVVEKCDAAPYWSKHVAREVFREMIKACPIRRALKD